MIGIQRRLEIGGDRQMCYTAKLERDWDKTRTNNFFKTKMSGLKSKCRNNYHYRQNTDSGLSKKS